MKFLNVTDIHNIVQKVQFRQLNFDEDLTMSVGVVLMNYGEGEVQVRCINGEWDGTKSDIPLGSGVPLCPNRHPLIELTRAPRLALVDEE